MLEDKRLISELERGDKEALRQIYEKYKDNLMAIAASMLHDVCAAEDVVHDVFVSLARGAGRLKLRGKLRNYLIAATVNRVHDVFNKRSYQYAESDRVGMINSNPSDPEQRVILSEESRRLIEALARLPLEQREAIILRFNGRMKFRQIANLQGTSTSTVQARFYYGLNKLRAILCGEPEK